jgi:hypothetical protein
LRHRDPAKAVFREEHLVTEAFEAEPKQPPNIRFVVDHQHSGHVPISSLHAEGGPWGSSERNHHEAYDGCYPERSRHARTGVDVRERGP